MRRTRVAVAPAHYPPQTDLSQRLNCLAIQTAQDHDLSFVLSVPCVVFQIHMPAGAVRSRVEQLYSLSNIPCIYI
jgi:hypothetical protein